MRTSLPISLWGHVILHAIRLVRIRPTIYHKVSPLQLAFGQEPNISHLRIFGCPVYVPIVPPQHTSIGPQRRLGIYVRYESSSIIIYLEPLTRDLFTVRIADCHFNESGYPTCHICGAPRRRNTAYLTSRRSYTSPYLSFITLT